MVHTEYVLYQGSAIKFYVGPDNLTKQCSRARKNLIDLFIFVLNPQCKLDQICIMCGKLA